MTLRGWLKVRVGHAVHLRLLGQDSGQTLTLAHVGWRYIEGVDTDGDAVCTRIGAIVTAYAGERVERQVQKVEQLKAAIEEHLTDLCPCPNCAEERRGQVKPALSEEEIAAALAEDGVETRP
jgi:hypothetical protein